MSKQEQTEIGAKELAERVGADPKELRKWLRAEGLKAGPGKRYAFSAQEATKLAGWFKKSQEEDNDAS